MPVVTTGTIRDRFCTALTARMDHTTAAPVGSCETAELGEHLQFFAEGRDPFQMPRKHAPQHHKLGHLEIEDWQS